MTFLFARVFAAFASENVSDEEHDQVNNPPNEVKSKDEVQHDPDEELKVEDCVASL